MNADEMRERTKRLALRIVRLVGSLPGNRVCDVLGRQILKAGTSIGANYREALRASSKRHFVTTLEIALRECDETDYWLDLLVESEVVNRNRLLPLIGETRQVLAILAASVRTAKNNLARGKRQPARKSEI